MKYDTFLTIGMHAELRAASPWGPFFCHLPIPHSILIDDLKMQGRVSPMQKNNLIKQLVAETPPGSLSSEGLCTAISFTGAGTRAVKQWVASLWTNIEKRGNEAHLTFCLCFWHGSKKCSESARAAVSLEKRRISPEWQELKTRGSDCAVPMPSVPWPRSLQTQAKLGVLLLIDGMPKRAINWSAVTPEGPACE